MAARRPVTAPSMGRTRTTLVALAWPGRRPGRLLAALCALLLLVPAASAQMVASPSRSPARAPAPLTPEAVADLRLREIGPANMSGRIVDVAVNERNPYVFYVASATGGVWKTTNNGVTYEPVFENQGTHSVGAIALHPQDTALIWVGTGERASRQSSSWGDGVYRSGDGGRTWTHMGLRDTHHIGRIALHPSDPGTVFVAAMGHLWGPNEERGLYKSTDGGATWRRTLYVDENTGVVDVAIDPEQPAVMYAASYQRRRTPYAFHGGGPGSALWKSSDGGETWTKLGPTAAVSVAASMVGGDGKASDADAPDESAGAGDSDVADDSLRVNGGINAIGLPAGEYGRIGISIHRADPRIVIASVEQGWRYNASTAYVERRAGVYRSEDRGETWEH
ncbi:MAG: WD40/YVTN/BNR-like repeat-containing protein, partial [Longimicrobiales bacterium]